MLSQRALLPAILLLALGLRAAAAWGPSVHHPDEIFQYLEQAHRLLFGQGYVPWEYRDGMRSWLVPLMLAGPMALGEAIAPGTGAHVLLPRLATAVASLGVVWGAWAIGARASRTHAALAALAAATWFELIHYAGHTLTETIATAAAVPALALLLTRETARATATAGALLALAALARFHYAPALALAALWACRLDRRRWAALLAGAAPVLALSAAVDVAMGMTPFGWIAANVKRNVIDGASAAYGVSGPFHYFRELSAEWRFAFVPVIFLAVFGAQGRLLLLAVAAAVVATHMPIGHKEPRFIMLATTLIVVLAGLGVAELLRHAPRRLAMPLALASVTAWVAASLALAVTTPTRWRWTNEAPALAAAARAGRLPGVCGVATYDMRFWQTGGYSYLHRDVPLYVLSARDELGVPSMDAATLRLVSGGFDAIVTTAKGAADVPASYRKVACFEPTLAPAAERAGRAACLFRRPGGCDAVVAEGWRLR